MNQGRRPQQEDDNITILSLIIAITLLTLTLLIINT